MENIHPKKRITDWPREERPREKLIRHGAEHISNAELIAWRKRPCVLYFQALSFKVARY